MTDASEGKAIRRTPPPLPKRSGTLLVCLYPQGAGRAAVSPHRHRRGSVSPETPQSWWNVGGTEVHSVGEFRPASEIKSVFETTLRLAKDGKLGKGFCPYGQYAVICHGSKRDVRVVQRTEGWGVFFRWPFGKLRGVFQEAVSDLTMTIGRPPVLRTSTAGFPRDHGTVALY